MKTGMITNRVACWLLVLAVIAGVALPASRVDAQGLRVLYLDEFAANVADWKLATTDASMEVSDGALAMTTNKAGVANWATPALTVPDDVDVEVEIEPDNAAGVTEWNVALVLRADTRDQTASFYHFGVTGTGYWEFRYRQKNPTSYTESISDGKLDSFDPTALLDIKVSARGNNFKIWVNGNYINEFTSDLVPGDPFQEKYIGLMNGTYTNASESRVKFRRVTAYQPNSDNVLLSEDFSATNPNGWRVHGRPAQNSQVEVTNGTLAVTIRKANLIDWSFPDTKFPEDVSIEAHAAPTVDAGVKDWGYGVGFRAYGDGDAVNFYLFEVQGGGTFTLTVQQGGKVIKTLQDTTVIEGFDATSITKLGVVAVGQQITLYVNDTQVAQVTDDTILGQPDYGVLLAAGTYPKATCLRVNFSNLIVKKP